MAHQQVIGNALRTIDTTLRTPAQTVGLPGVNPLTTTRALLGQADARQTIIQGADQTPRISVNLLAAALTSEADLLQNLLQGPLQQGQGLTDLNLLGRLTGN